MANAQAPRPEDSCSTARIEGMDHVTATDSETIFDADNHYWEPSDAFTRHRDPAFSDRGVCLVEVDGKPHYYVDGKQHPIIPGPGDAHPRPRPGALYDYFAGRTDKSSLANALTAEDPADHPEWFERDARIRRMDAQGVEATWIFPSHAVCVEGPMQPDIEASLEIFRAFNRWLDEDWGFAYQDRIFGVPFLSLSDLERAIAELEWTIDRGARIVTIRNGPVFTADGYRSPADPRFDPFWCRVAEAQLVVAPHAGFDDGYREVDQAVARAWGYGEARHGGDTDALSVHEPFVEMLQKHRIVEDFAIALVAHGLFQRVPGLRVAYIENGATWVPDLLHKLGVYGGQNPQLFTTSPTEQFIEHCWVAPFVEDSVEDLAKHLPVNRILFGSDWPHAEGMAEPRDFLKKVASFAPRDQRRIMA
jgi:predicted TIM-barrel fold metal-dependent hydrolase